VDFVVEASVVERSMGVGAGGVRRDARSSTAESTSMFGINILSLWKATDVCADDGAESQVGDFKAENGVNVIAETSE
jgi:hypothetical protein